MQKSPVVIPVLFLLVCFVASTAVYADTSTSSSSSTSTSSSKSHSKKKASPTPTAQPTIQPTAIPKTLPKVTPTPAPAAAPAAKIFSDNPWIYGTVGASGDLKKAIAAASRNIGSSSLKRDRSVFLWLGRVTSGDDNFRENTYVRFNLAGITYGGPRKPWIVLTGTIDAQSGSDFKAGDSIEVAVDFRDIKVDYEGTKLGEVNKGNDIADQVNDILYRHSNFQWVLIAQDYIRNQNDSMGLPTYVVKAHDGYAFLQAMDTHSTTNPSDR